MEVMPTSATIFIFVLPWRNLVTTTDDAVWGRCCYQDAHWSVICSDLAMSGEIPPMYRGSELQAVPSAVSMEHFHSGV